MYKIGEVSSMTGVPVKTIRYYDEIGLLVPAETDNYTGYRRYSDANIEELLKIIYLKGIGFRLAEIKNFDDSSLKAKIKELKSQMNYIRKNISDISHLYKNKEGEYIMKNFINDEALIGKWHLIGLCDSEEDIEKNYYQQKDYRLKDITILPNGDGYWIYTFWTKGYIFINNVPMKYFYKDDKLVIAFDHDLSGTVEYYAVYKNVDHNKYTKEDLRLVDNVDLPYVEDKEACGVWKTCGLVKDIESFDKSVDYKKRWGRFLYENIVLISGGQAIITYSNGNSNSRSHRWTKGCIMDTDEKLASKYEIKDNDGHKYLFMEHKSGDYCYGHMKPYYFVFKKD